MVELNGPTPSPVPTVAPTSTPTLAPVLTSPPFAAHVAALCPHSPAPAPFALIRPPIAFTRPCASTVKK